MPRERLRPWAECCDAILAASTNQFDAETIAKLPKSVRAIATFSVGTDHVDLAAARARGLIVTNTPDVLTDATADIAMLLLLGAARRAWEGQAMLRAGRWDGWTPTQLLGVHVTAKRLGILGMGRIGQALARVIARDASGDLEGIRFTDRNIPPQSLPLDRVEAFYRAYKAYWREVNDPAAQFRYAMRPGDLHVFDNHRVLHGRLAFDPTKGPRHLQQCAVARDEFHSTLRVLATRLGNAAAEAPLDRGALR